MKTISVLIETDGGCTTCTWNDNLDYAHAFFGVLKQDKCMTLKGVGHLKMSESFTHSHVVLYLYDILSYVEHK